MNTPRLGDDGRERARDRRTDDADQDDQAPAPPVGERGHEQRDQRADAREGERDADPRVGRAERVADRSAELAEERAARTTRPRSRPPRSRGSVACSAVNGDGRQARTPVSAAAAPVRPTSAARSAATACATARRCAIATRGRKNHPKNGMSMAPLDAMPTRDPSRRRPRCRASARSRAANRAAARPVAGRRRSSVAPSCSIAAARTASGGARRGERAAAGARAACYGRTRTSPSEDSHGEARRRRQGTGVRAEGSERQDRAALGLQGPPRRRVLLSEGRHARDARSSRATCATRSRS